MLRFRLNDEGGPFALMPEGVEGCCSDGDGSAWFELGFEGGRTRLKPCPSKEGGRCCCCCVGPPPNGPPPGVNWPDPAPPGPIEYSFRLTTSQGVPLGPCGCCGGGGGPPLAASAWSWVIELDRATTCEARRLMAEEGENSAVVEALGVATLVREVAEELG